MKWLKEVQKGCSVKYLFYFLCGLQCIWNSSKANLAVYFLVWPQAGPRRCSCRVCNCRVLNRDFSADSGTQCLRIYLLSFDTVGQDRSCFSLKLLTNNYKFNVFGRFFWSIRTLKILRVFIIGEFLTALLSFNV